MDNWENVDVSLPKVGKDVVYVDKDGNDGYAYISYDTPPVWKCSVTNENLSVEIIKWMYV